ncbi:hypothetical protein HYU11_02370 [Candidatus Woesearchaeota archaeon]|nr:hypothetical protein [Candidatus Woesearchaeota archaeon]
MFHGLVERFHAAINSKLSTVEIAYPVQSAANNLRKLESILLERIHFKAFQMQVSLSERRL